MSAPWGLCLGEMGCGPVVVGASWMFTAVGVVAVLLWARSRWRKWGVLGWDVWVVVVAVVVRIVFQIRYATTFGLGLGRHHGDLTPDQKVEGLKVYWTSLPGSTAVSCLGRVSITTFFVRFFGGTYRRFKWYLLVLTTLQMIGAVLSTVLLFCEFDPVAGLWDVDMPSRRRYGGYAWVSSAYVDKVLSSLTDLTYALFPVVFIWNLDMTLRRRSGVMLVACASLITMTTSTIYEWSVFRPWDTLRQWQG